MATAPDTGARVPARLPKLVFTLGWVSLFTDIASEMVYPVIPLFVVGALGAPVLALGAIEGVAEAIVSVMKGLSGWHSDVSRRRVPYVRWGYGFGNGAKLLLTVAFAWPMVMLARLVDRLGKGLRTSARDALIADVIVPGQAGSAYGLHRAMDTAGAFAGVLIAAGLLYLLPGWYRLIFGLALVPGVLAVLTSFRVKEPEARPQEADAGERQRVSLRTLPGSYWRVCGLLTLFALANSSDTFLLLRASGLGMADSHVVLTYAFYNLAYALTSYPAGVVSDRLGRWRVIGLGWVLYAAAYAGFALVQTPAVLWVLFLVYGVYMGLTQGVGKALIADFAPAHARGTALGVYHFATGIGVLTSSLLAGWLWDRFGPQAAFGVGAVAALVSAALIPVLIRRPQPTTDRP